jgi:hypothetical protein
MKTTFRVWALGLGLGFLLGAFLDLLGLLNWPGVPSG